MNPTCTATLQRLHDNMVIAVRFPNEAALNQRFRQLPGARWSQTLNSWYVPDTAVYRQRFGLPFLLPADKPVPDRLPAAIASVPAERPPGAMQPGTGIHPCNREVLVQVQKLLILKGYSTSTQKTYLNEVSQLLQLLGRIPAEQLHAIDLQRYFLYCHQKLQLSENTLHSRINAVKFYYEQVLHREKMFIDIPRPKKQLQTPRFFNQDEVAALLNHTGNIKHKVMLMLAYSSGLRVSEVVSIKTRNIDSARMCLLIEQAKGKKDRMVNLSPVLLVMLREYWKQCRPLKDGYLFEGQWSGSPYSTRSLQLVLQAAKKRAGVLKPGSIHALRHSFATHLLDKGADVVMIMKLLGHNDIKTTLRYLHVSNRDILQVISPLDNLNLI